VLKLILGDDTMANLTSAINIQVDSDTKKQATDILNNLGLSMSTAINIFLKQVIKRDGIPFEIVNNKPNEEMLKAVQEVKEMISHPNDYPLYTNREDLKKALLSDNE
jgi:DNA-damage-inducible protein J